MLWDEFAGQITEFTGTNTLPIVMVLCFAKIKFWSGKVSISNALHCTKLYLNPPIPDVDEFKKNMDSANESSSHLSHLSSTVKNSVFDDFIHTERKTLDEIAKLRSHIMH